MHAINSVVSITCHRVPVEKPRRVHEQAQSTIGRAVSIFHVILRYVKKLKKYHVKKIQESIYEMGRGLFEVGKWV